MLTSLEAKQEGTTILIRITSTLPIGDTNL